MLICNAPEGPVLLMLPSTDCRIDDTWFVVGLRGSGSKDVVVDGAFVPRHRAVSMNDVKEGCTPGRAIHGAPNYRIPMRSILSFTLSASVLGMAQGGLDVFSETTQGRVSGRTGGKFAEADAGLRAAQALLKHNCAEIFGKARDSQSFTLEERARYRRDQSYIARLSVQAIDRVFEASGRKDLFEPIRCRRSTGTFMQRPPTIAGVRRSSGAVREGPVGNQAGMVGPLINSRYDWRGTGPAMRRTGMQRPAFEVEQ